MFSNKMEGGLTGTEEVKVLSTVTHIFLFPVTSIYGELDSRIKGTICSIYQECLSITMILMLESLKQSHCSSLEPIWETTLHVHAHAHSVLKGPHKCI